METTTMPTTDAAALKEQAKAILEQAKALEDQAKVEAQAEAEKAARERAAILGQVREWLGRRYGGRVGGRLEDPLPAGCEHEIPIGDRTVLVQVGGDGWQIELDPKVLVELWRPGAGSPLRVLTIPRHKDPHRALLVGDRLFLARPGCSQIEYFETPYHKVPE